MRTFKATLFLLAVFLVVVPAPVQAWFGWLDNLSGPGPFWGAEFDFRMVCLMEQAPTAEAMAVTQLASHLIGSLTPPERFKEISAQLKTLSEQLPPGLSDERGRKAAINLASQAHKLSEQLTALSTANTPSSNPDQSQNAIRGPLADEAFLAAERALERVESSLREAAVPAVSKFPGSVVWASCSDRSSSGEPRPVNGLSILRGDRHPVLSLVLNYREYTNWDYTHWGHVSDATYAEGHTIHLRIIEPKVAWPLSGHFDVLDGQAGMGLYSFSSRGLPGTRAGLIVEPIRFDLHFPSRLSDDSTRNFWERLVLALSFRAGLVLFPAGFAPDAFSATGDAKRRISGGEAIFEYGIVINVGRLPR